MTITFSTFNVPDLDTLTQQFANNHPVGKLAEAAHIPDSVYNKLLRGLAKTQQTYLLMLKQFIDSYVPYGSDFILSPWEKSVGIPDDIFIIDSDDAKRARNIQIKLFYMRLSTAASYERLATFMGIDAIVTSGDNEDPQLLNTIVININGQSPGSFPLTFPFTFPSDSDDFQLFESICNKQKPITDTLVFHYSESNYQKLTQQRKQGLI